MSRLDELIAELCPNGIPFRSLGITCSISTGKGVTKKDIVEDGQYEIISGGVTPLGKIDKWNREGRVVTIARAGSAGFVDWHEKPIYLNDKCFSIVPKDKNLLESKYLYYSLKNLESSITGMKTDGTVPTVNTEKISKICVPVPPLPVQHEIVRILDNFTELTVELTAELTARKKQYEYYKEKLLTLHSYPYYSLAELCEIVDYRGKTPQKVEKGVFLVTAKNIRQGYIDYEKSQEYISEEDYDDVMHRGIPQIGDVLITTEAPCGYVAQVDREHIALAQRVIKYRPKSDSLDSSFLKYVLLGQEFQEKLLAAATGGTVKGIKGSKLHKLTIPLPPVELQKKIVSVLNKFDSLCTDISRGLPAEIEARQKQYEYYRDLLFSFPEVTK